MGSKVCAKTIPMCLLFFGLTSQQILAGETPKPERVRVGTPAVRFFSYLPFELGVKEGLFKAEGKIGRAHV